MLNPRSKLRDRIREATEDAILDAAEAQFAADGLHGAKVDRIATQAGVSVGTVYNYFEDREGVFRALIEARRRQLLETLETALGAAQQKPFREKLLVVVESLYAHADAHRRFFEILILGEHEKHQAGRGTPKQLMKELYGRFESVVADGVREGAVKPEVAELASTFLLGATRAVLVREIYEKKGELKPRAAEVVRFFLEGVGAK